MLIPLEIDMASIPLLVMMEENGMMVDREYFANLTEEFNREAETINEKIDDLYGRHVNPNSPGANGQVSKMLVDMGIYRRPDSVDAEHLSKHRGKPVVDLILEYKEIKHLIDSFCKQLPAMADDNGRIHTQILHTRTATGRFASKNPNLQQIPTRTQRGRKIRRGFVAPDSWILLAADYSQIELRLPAHMADDEAMIEVFQGGGDIHTATAAKMFGIEGSEVDSKKHRRPAKDVNFGILYGITPEGLCDGFINRGVTEFTVEDCKWFIGQWFKAYPGVKQWIDETHAFIRRNGYAETMFGRRRLIPEVYSKHEKIREAGIRQGGNHPIQGTAGDIMKVAMRDVMPIVEKYGEVLKPLMTIHDELLFEVKLDADVITIAAEIKEAMENVVQLKVPLKIDIELGSNWADMEEIEI